jgi:hypothetical protein
MSMLDKIRQKQSRPPTAAPPVQPAKEKPKPTAGPARVTYSCGHEDNNRPCKTCLNARSLRRVERKRKKRQGSLLLGLAIADERRLPDGAAFTVTYNAESRAWAGKLAIGGAVFEGEASGVFRLLEDLDATYRTSIGVPPAAEPAAEPKAPEQDETQAEPIARETPSPAVEPAAASKTKGKRSRSRSKRKGE